VQCTKCTSITGTHMFIGHWFICEGSWCTNFILMFVWNSNQLFVMCWIFILDTYEYVCAYENLKRSNTYSLLEQTHTSYQYMPIKSNQKAVLL